MKKNVLLISLGIVALWLFSACASTQPSTVTVVQPVNAELAQLRVKTTAATRTSTAYEAEEENVVYLETTNGDVIEAEDGKTYVFIDEDDYSYERRMRMFDDPRYTVTINLGWDSWYNDNWYYSSWHNPYYAFNYRWGFNWYTPSWMYPAYSMWYNPWYYSWYYPIYNPWCGGWHNHYAHHHHHNNYGWNSYRPNHYAYSYSPERRSSSYYSDNNRRDNNSRGVSSSRNPNVRQIAGSTRGTETATRPGTSGRGQSGNVDRKVVTSRETGITNNRGTGTATTAIGKGRSTGNQGTTRETGITNNRGTGTATTAIGKGRSVETRTTTPNVKGRTPNTGSRNTQTYTRPETAGRSTYNQGNAVHPSSSSDRKVTTPSTSGNNYQSSGSTSDRRSTNNSSVKRNDSNGSSTSNSTNNSSYRPSSSSNNNSSGSSYRPSSSSSSRGGGSSSGSSSGGGSSRGGSSSRR